ncbi:MAG TPA: ester cyclase family protein [Saprospiraceae bacterium]|nr:ester cyclase family protein [Saprospiraceae bacterium]HMQ84324.1 ester cyclase family protein [Saprospiraceae bacterium]
MKTNFFFSVALFALATATTTSVYAGKYESSIRGFWAAVDKGDFDEATTFLHPDVAVIIPFSPVAINLEAYRQIGETFRMGFPDIQHQVLEVSEGKMTAAARCYFSGTNTAPLMGNPATGNRVEVPFLLYLTFDATGLITRFETSFDLANFNAQLMAGMDTESRNKEVALGIMQALDNRDLAEVAAAYDPGCRFNGWAPETLDVNGYIAMMSALLAAFPDSHFTVDDIIAEGDKVVVRHHLTGTHTGAEFMGAAISNKKVYVTATVTFEIKAGKPVELWLNADFLGLLMQIGAIPMPK